MKQQGKLASWNDEKGFGFITPTSGGPKVFVHISSFSRGQRRPAVNDPVTYSVTRDRQNRLRAKSVAYQGGAGRVWPRAMVSALCLLTGFFSLLAGLALSGVIPFVVVGFYAVMSVVSFAMYAVDKSAAQRGAWRTAESTLHLMELAGGWPGAFVAQRLFRHKTSKKAFQVVFWLAVTANCAALYWLVQATAAAGLRVSLGFG